MSVLPAYEKSEKSRPRASLLSWMREQVYAVIKPGCMHIALEAGGYSRIALCVLEADGYSRIALCVLEADGYSCIILCVRI